MSLYIVLYIIKKKTKKLISSTFHPFNIRLTRLQREFMGDIIENSNKIIKVKQLYIELTQLLVFIYSKHQKKTE